MSNSLFCFGPVRKANKQNVDPLVLPFKVVLDKIQRDSVAELPPRWINRSAGVDVWMNSHV